MDNFRQFLTPPHIDPPDQETIDILTDISEKEWKRNPIYQAELKKALAPRKARKRQIRKQWFEDNWVALLSLLFSFIAAVPVIIQGFQTILKSLGLSN